MFKFHHIPITRRSPATLWRLATALLPQRCCTTTNTTDILPIITAAKSLRQTLQAHAKAIILGRLPHSISISASLILSYAAFHSHTHRILLSLFTQSLPFSRSPFLHNTLIRALTVSPAVRENDGHFGFLVYNDLMVNSGFAPDDHTFPFVLKLCADCGQESKGLEVHGMVVKYGFDYDVFVNNTLMLFYGNCRDLGSVRKLFNEMPERDLISWNTIIGEYWSVGFGVESVRFFRDMVSWSGFKPNEASVVSLLPVGAWFEDEELVSCVHSYAVKVGLDGQVRVCNALVDAYGKCGTIEAMRGVFDEMDVRNDVSWNAIIGGFAYRGLNTDALDSFRRTISERVVLNSITIASVLPVLVELKLFGKGREVHGFSIRTGLDKDVFVANALLDMYGKWEHINEASSMFDIMSLRNVVSWNTMISNFAQNGLELEAIELVRRMQIHGEIPNSITLINVLPACARLCSLRHGKEIHARSIRKGSVFELFVSNAITDMYAKCGCMVLAQNLFNISLRDEVSYNILITGYSQTSHCQNSLALFSEMDLVGIKHDNISYMGVLAACSCISAIKQGKQIHAFAVRRLFHDHLFVANSLLDFYTKCGQINVSRKVFDQMPCRDKASWNTMILGFGMIGEVDTAISLFAAMPEDGVEYDSISYIAALSACSHGGLVEKGKEYFDDMLARNIKPSGMHYACLVDLLGRAGLMDEAVGVVKSLTIEPDTHIWGALLGACRLHGNVELGCWAAEHMLALKPDHSGYYTLLSNMYAEAGRWEEANRVRNLMKTRQVKKNPGFSWVQIQDQIQGFVFGQRLDPSLCHEVTGS